MNLVLLGPPGSGKGTLGNRLLEHYNLEEFVTGAELRRMARKDNPRGHKLRRLLAGGNMASTELVMGILQERVSQQPQGKNGWLMDGVPRNRGQAREFIKLLKQDQLDLDTVLVLQVSDSVARERLPGRTTCSECGTIYNDSDRPPPEPGQCRPGCGGKLKRRADDSPEGITQRLKLYHQRTEAAIEMLGEAELPIYEIDGEQSREQVFQKACQAIQKQQTLTHQATESSSGRAR